jgi:hypothetical protein
MRFIARATVQVLRPLGPARAARALPRALQQVSARALRLARARPAAGRRSPAVAARLSAARQRVVARAQGSGLLQQVRRLDARRRAARPPGQIPARPILDRRRPPP